MKFSTLLVAALSAAEFSIAAPTPSDNTVTVLGAGHFQEKHLQRLAKRANNPVTGNRKGYSGNARVYRQEIYNFANDKNGLVLNLFILALSRMQGLSRGNWVSYWEISGIHGQPYYAWNNEQQTGSGGGYCTHGSTLFPTWHRPYLALFEQTVWNNAQSIVNSIPTGASWKSAWEDALLSIRVPYWDWTQNNGQMHPCLTSEYYPVNQASNNQRVSFKNPLYSGYLKSGTYNQYFPDQPFNYWSKTFRYPTSTAPNAVSQMGAVNQQLAGNAVSLRQRVYTMFVDQQYSSWASFSNKGAASPGADSLEAIHDTIHGLTGNGGHMSYIDYSSFDPIFFLHHCNIDRLFAIWQALHPHTWVSGQRNTGGTFGIPAGTWEDANTNLTPFRGLNGQFWTSNSVRDTSTFGYGYLETPKWKYTDENKYAAFVRQQVNNLYGNTNRAVAQQKKRKRDVPTDPTNSTDVGLAKSLNNNQYWDWKIDVTANKMALGTPYFVHFFIRSPSGNAKEWSSQAGLVGDYYVFTGLKGMAVAPGIDPATVDPMVSGSVPLTPTLITLFNGTASGLKSLNPEDVVPYLQKNLRWRVTLADDTRVPAAKVSDLLVDVAAAIVTLPESNDGSEFPSYGDYKVFSNITRKIGKNGGSGPGANAILPPTVPSDLPSIVPTDLVPAPSAA